MARSDWWCPWSLFGSTGLIYLWSLLLSLLWGSVYYLPLATSPVVILFPLANVKRILLWSRAIGVYDWAIQAEGWWGTDPEELWTMV